MHIRFKSCSPSFVVDASLFTAKDKKTDSEHLKGVYQTK